MHRGDDSFVFERIIFWTRRMVNKLRKKNMNHRTFLPILTGVAIAFAGLTASAFDHSHSALTTILKTYVNGVGMVDYAGLKENRAGLDAYLKTTAAVTEADFKGWNEKQQIAFLTNVYNAETLQYIVDNYPVKSIKKLGPLIGSSWDEKNVELFGKKTTLNKVEHDMLRVDYDEPRLHFALVCAAISCPPLRAEAYTADELDAQLTDQAKVFLAQSKKNRVEGGTVYLSKIFDWYGDDFEKDGKGVLDFIDTFYDADTTKLKIKYTDYDWDLNKQ